MLWIAAARRGWLSRSSSLTTSTRQAAPSRTISKSATCSIVSSPMAKRAGSAGARRDSISASSSQSARKSAIRALRVSGVDGRFAARREPVRRAGRRSDRSRSACADIRSSSVVFRRWAGPESRQKAAQWRMRTYIEHKVVGQIQACVGPKQRGRLPMAPLQKPLRQNSASFKILKINGLWAHWRRSEVDRNGEIWYRTNNERACRISRLKKSVNRIAGSCES